MPIPHGPRLTVPDENPQSSGTTYSWSVMNPEHLCSAKGCTAPATWDLLWNNPKLHTPDRRKTWLACDDHKQSLSDFLGARSFLKDVVPHEG